MPQAAIIAAAWIGNAVVAVTGSAAIGAAVANGVAALGFAQGIGAGIGAWATVASVASLARGKPRIGGNGGTQVDFKADPQAGIPYAIGETGIGGNIVFAGVSEAKNNHLLYLTVFSAGPIEAITGFRVNDQPVTFGALGNADGFYHNFMVELRQAGAHAPAPFMPPATTLASFPEWSTSHKLTGYAAQWWVLEYDAKKYPTGTPKPLTLGKWVKVYDPRLDSTYPGGSGLHRSNDEATWAWSANPFLHALTWCIGRRQNGKRILGVGAPIELIDVAAFVEGANVCDANGWTAHGLAYSTDDKWQVLAAMLQAGGGWPTASGAKISCGVNAPRVSLATMTGADQAGGDVELTAVRSRRDRFNAVIPRYRSADHGYQIVAAAKFAVSAYVAEDGEENTVEPEFPLCQDVNQAAQLGAYAISNSRELGPIVIPAKPRWWGYRPNDCITISEPEWGLNAQKCVILNRERDPQTGVVTLTLQTETDGKHPFCLGKTGTPPPSAGLTGRDPTQVPLPDEGAWAVTQTYLAGGDGSLPAIVITGGIDTGLVTHIIVDYREVLGGGTYGPWASQEFPSTATQLIVTGLKPNTIYQVRIRYRTVRGVDNPDAGTDLGDHLTGGVGVSTIGGMTVGEVLAKAEEASNQGKALVKASLEFFNRAVEERAALVQQTFHEGETVKRIVVAEDESFEEGRFSILKRLQLMGIVVPDGSAFQFNETTLKASPTETWGQYKTALATTIGDNAAAISSEITARTGADSALALSLSSVSTTVGDHTSSITTLQSSVNGISASYLLVVDAGTHRASVQAYAGSSLSSLIFTADQIGFTNGATDRFPFAIVGGVLKATNMEIDTIKASTVVTGHIVGSAVTQITWAEQAYGLNLTTSAAQVFSMSHTTSVGGAGHEVKFYCTFINSGSNAGVVMTLKRDGTTIAVRNFFAQGPFTTTATMMAFDQPAAGSHTYSIEANTTGGSGTSCQLSVSGATVMELKR